jgi:hypothetical protein
MMGTLGTKHLKYILLEHTYLTQTIVYYTYSFSSLFLKLDLLFLFIINKSLYDLLR